MLCPGCARREQGKSGLCEPCRIRSVSERYVLDDHRQAEARAKAWAERTADDELQDEKRKIDRLYQQRSRIFRRTHPRSSAPPSIDPLVVADRALQLLAGVQDEEQIAPAAVRREVAELIRWLAWGPNGPSRETATVDYERAVAI